MAHSAWVFTSIYPVLEHHVMLQDRVNQEMLQDKIQQEDNIACNPWPYQDRSLISNMIRNYAI